MLAVLEFIFQDFCALGGYACAGVRDCVASWRRVD